MTAFRPTGHTPASRRYLAQLGAQLERAHEEHARLCDRATRLFDRLAEGLDLALEEGL